MVCLEVSHGTWGPDPVMYQLNDPSLRTALMAGFRTMKGKRVSFSDFGYDKSWTKKQNEQNDRSKSTRRGNPTTTSRLDMAC